MTINNSNDVTERQQAFNAIMGVQALPPSDASLPSLPEELEQLLWLFVDDRLNDTEMNRLCELTANEPATLGHLSRMLEYASLEEPLDEAVMQRALKHVRSGDAPAQESLDSELFSPNKSAAIHSAPPDSSAAGWLPDLQIGVAMDQLLASLFGLGGLGLSPSAARSGADERRTSLEKQILKSNAVYHLTVDHAGRYSCHVTVEIQQHQFGFPLEQLTVQVRDSQNQLLEAKAIVDRAARFRNLSTGRYSLLIVRQDQLLDEIRLQFDTSSES